MIYFNKYFVCCVCFCFHCVLFTVSCYLCFRALLFLLLAIRLLTHCVNKQALNWIIKRNPGYICSDVWKFKPLNYPGSILGPIYI
jgi:hypothetical protein